MAKLVLDEYFESNPQMVNMAVNSTSASEAAKSNNLARMVAVTRQPLIPGSTREEIEAAEETDSRGKIRRANFAKTSSNAACDAVDLGQDTTTTAEKEGKLRLL